MVLLYTGAFFPLARLPLIPSKSHDDRQEKGKGKHCKIYQIHRGKRYVARFINSTTN